MTPAVSSLRKANVKFQLHSFENKVAHAYAAEAASALELQSDRVFKTLIAQDQNGRLITALVPAPLALNLKKLAAVVKTKKVILAEQGVAERATGYLKGGISPFGQKTNLVTVVHQSASHFKTIYVSGGRRGLEIEITPTDLIATCRAVMSTIC